MKKNAIRKLNVPLCLTKIVQSENSLSYLSKSPQCRKMTESKLINVRELRNASQKNGIQFLHGVIYTISSSSSELIPDASEGAISVEFDYLGT